MAILTHIPYIELQSLYHNEKSDGEVTIMKLMVISENQAHFQTLTVGHKKLIYLVKKGISIDNLEMCFCYCFQISWRPQRIGCEFNWVIDLFEFNMLRSKSLYISEYLRKTLFSLLNCKLT